MKLEKIHIDEVCLSVSSFQCVSVTCVVLHVQHMCSAILCVKWVPLRPVDILPDKVYSKWWSTGQQCLYHSRMEYMCVLWGCHCQKFQAQQNLNRRWGSFNRPTQGCWNHFKLCRSLNRLCLLFHKGQWRLCSHFSCCGKKIRHNSVIYHVKGGLNLGGREETRHFKRTHLQLRTALLHFSNLSLPLPVEWIHLTF